MQLRKIYFLSIILAIFSIFALLDIEINEAFATTISPRITYSSNKEYVLKVREYKNNRILFFCYKKHGHIYPHAKLIVYSPSGRKYKGTRIYRNRAVYLLINPSTGNYRAVLYINNRRISFPTIRIVSNTSTSHYNSNTTQKAKIIPPVKYPHEIDLGRPEKSHFRVLVKTNTATTKVLLKANNIHTFRLIRNTGSYKLWEWDWTPPPTEQKYKIMQILAYNNKQLGDKRTIRVRFHKDLISILINTIKKDENKRGGQCKAYLYKTFNKIARTYRFYYRGKLLTMPRNQKVRMPSNIEASIEWKPSDIFIKVASYKAGSNQQKNRKKVIELLKKAKRGDFLQMEWNPNNSKKRLTPHTLIFVEDVKEGKLLNWCDSNLNGDEIVHCGTRYPWGSNKTFISLVNYLSNKYCTNNCGATLYRINPNVLK